MFVIARRARAEALVASGAAKGGTSRWIATARYARLLMTREQLIG
jgi:hypothetical protein